MYGVPKAFQIEADQAEGCPGRVGNYRHATLECVGVPEHQDTPSQFLDQSRCRVDIRHANEGNPSWPRAFRRIGTDRADAGPGVAG